MKAIDRKSTVHPPVNPVAPPPVELVASIHFKWEEKPGKPLLCFSQPTPESATQPAPANSIALPWPPVYFQGNDANGNSSCHTAAEDDDNDDDDDHDDEQKGMFESDLEACSFETDESLAQLPLLANRLVSTMAISSAVPRQQTPLTENQCGQPQTPPSPASEQRITQAAIQLELQASWSASFHCCHPI